MEAGGEGGRVVNLQVSVERLQSQVAGSKELIYLHRGALTLIFGPFGADVLL